MQEAIMREDTELAKRNMLRLSNMEANRLSKECFTMALIYLMNEKPFDKISISELVKRSGVSRTAFYRNYTCKEDVLKELGQGLIQAIRERLGTDEVRGNPYNFFLGCFLAVQEKSKIYDLLLHANIPLDMLVPNGSIMGSIHPAESVREHYRQIGFEAAFYKILQEWFENGMKESPVEMAEFCAGLLPATISEEK